MKTITAIFAFIVTCQAVSYESLILEEWRAFKDRIWSSSRAEFSPLIKSCPGNSRLALAVSCSTELFASSKKVSLSYKYEPLMHIKQFYLQTTFNKSYSNLQEESFRREIFLENRHKIAMKNIDFANGIITYSESLNRFADMLNNEFTYIINGFNRTARLNPDTAGSRELPRNIRSSTYIRPLNVNLPDRIDWREYGGVTAVKYQGMCASCYAFSAAGAIEGQTFRKTGQLVELSPQNLVDCTKPYGNSGCNGGLMDGAYEYVRDNYGIDSEPGYPYEAQDGLCRYRPEDKSADDTGYVQIDEGDEEGMKLVLATLGPVSVAIDAGQDAFQFYSDGVYYDVNCQSDVDKMNHAVLIVGYGTESNGQDYWLVKNSYGTDWGQGGYIKMARNANNHCGIANGATYPLV